MQIKTYPQVDHNLIVWAGSLDLTHPDFSEQTNYARQRYSVSSIKIHGKQQIHTIESKFIHYKYIKITCL